MLSTDDDEIAELGRCAGLEVPFRRPKDAASDTASATDVILHALDALAEEFDYLVYLQPTSPLRTEADVDGCLELLLQNGADFCVSVQEVAEHPEWMFYLGDNHEMAPLRGTANPSRRQDLRPCYVLNGAVYAARVSAFRATPGFITPNTLGYVMPRERGVDIDDEDDLVLAESLLARARSAPA